MKIENRKHQKVDEAQYKLDIYNIKCSISLQHIIYHLQSLAAHGDLTIDKYIKRTLTNIHYIFGTRKRRIPT